MELVGDVKGKKVLLIDDMVDTAGSLVKATEVLIEKGAAEVSACITTHKTDKGIEINLYNKNKPHSYYKDLYEDVKIVIENGVLTLEGNHHLRKYILSFDTHKFWIENLEFLPLPEDEHVIKEGYKNIIDKWKGKKSKYIENHEVYTYHKMIYKIKSNTFSINYQSGNVLESKEELQTFNKFVETK